MKLSVPVSWRTHFFLIQDKKQKHPSPFHLIPQHIGVFVDQDSYLESFELACQLHTLKQQVAEYALEEALKQQAKDAQKIPRTQTTKFS